MNVRDIVAKLPPPPILWILDMEGYRYGEATLEPTGQRVVAMSRSLARLVDNTIRARTTGRLGDRVQRTVDSGEMLANDELIVPVQRNDGWHEHRIALSEVDR